MKGIRVVQTLSQPSWPAGNTHAERVRPSRREWGRRRRLLGVSAPTTPFSTMWATWPATNRSGEGLTTDEVPTKSPPRGVSYSTCAGQDPSLWPDVVKAG
eukprot:1633286-Pleurochrysis_carterae.AAC.7